MKSQNKNLSENSKARLVKSFKKFLRGEEDFWTTLLGWGLLLYSVSFLVLIFAAYCYITIILPIGPNITGILQGITFIGLSIIVQICGIWGIILATIYPIIFGFSLIRSSLQNSIIYIIFASLLVILLVLFHAVYFLFTIFTLFLGLLNGPLIMLFLKIKSFLLLTK